MHIDQQIQQLIQQASLYGTKAEEMQMVAPVFKAIASRLQRDQYYILQNLEQNWIMTTLQHRTQAATTKRVVYAYPSLEAAKVNSALDLDAIAQPLPTVQILFQLLAIEPVDSLIFFEHNQDQEGTEISRQGLQQAIEQHIRARLIPPDIA
jgi:hypothetical protein